MKQAQEPEVRDSSFYEESQRAYKVGCYVRAAEQVGASAAQVALAPAEGWERLHELAEEIAEHSFKPGSLKTQLMVVQVLRIRERARAERPLPRPAPVAIERVPPAAS